MPNRSSYDLAKVIRDLLTIAKVAMPRHLLEIDPRIRAAEALLQELRPSAMRPPAVSRSDQPPILNLGEADPSDPDARRLAAVLDAMPAGGDWDISAALDRLQQEPGAPGSRAEAISMILRDWLVGHGYLEPTPEAPA